MKNRVNEKVIMDKQGLEEKDVFISLGSIILSYRGELGSSLKTLGVEIDKELLSQLPIPQKGFSGSISGNVKRLEILVEQSATSSSIRLSSKGPGNQIFDMKTKSIFEFMSKYAAFCKKSK